VPCIVASPFTGVQAGATPVAHGLYDHTSVLKLIEWRWGLKPLTQRDASTASTDPGNLASILNLAAPSPRVPRQIPNLPPFVPTACVAPLPSVTSPSAAPSTPSARPPARRSARVQLSPAASGNRRFPPSRRMARSRACTRRRGRC
jgi:phospholipase C